MSGSLRGEGRLGQNKILLNARGRLCRVHMPRWLSPTAPASAQRPGASLSGSLLADRLASPWLTLLNARGRLCRVHRTSAEVWGVFSAAQRPGASLSGSHRSVTRTLRSNDLLNARGRLCRVHKGGVRQVAPCWLCSTPGGVFVGFTTMRSGPPMALPTAQRPGASLSGSPEDDDFGVVSQSLLNARGRLCRVHPRLKPSVPVMIVLLNARGRLCRVHSMSGRSV